ncbi:ParB/RepB/Spo0J family partition protein [Nocardia africana]|uniref:ParB/RepB/Spo0J family partition protein n=1 Tax=Nocardia africana TaxID=134964 RepID=A0ABW6NIX8_9NOCA
MSAQRKANVGAVVPLTSDACYRVELQRLLPADSPRSTGEDRRHIVRLAESESQWPPILVHRATMRVIDGMHRVHAARMKGMTHIEVLFFDGSAAEAFLRGVESNVVHGLPLTLPDRKAAAERILESMPELSDRTIATSTGLSSKTVARIRLRSTGEIPQSNIRIGADGRTRPLDSSRRRQQVIELLTASPDMPLRALAAAADVSVSTAHAIRKKMRERLCPDGDTAEGPDTNALLLQKLTRDPAMRASQQGRDLLRWLHSHSMNRKMWPRVAEAVPPHLAATVAELASRNAREWRAFADRIQSSDTAI